MFYSSSSLQGLLPGMGLLTSVLAGPVPLEIYPSDIPNKGMLFVNHEASGRSGHGGQAIAECLNGDIIAFYSNVCGDTWGGHSVSGWSEYRRSSDGGETWSEPYVLKYSKSIWEGDEFHSALVDEVITAPNGTLVAIAGRYLSYDWKRTTPVYLLSHDNGSTWSEAREVHPGADSSEIGREHASFVRGNTIYVLFNQGLRGSHRLYVSTDNGESFQQRSVLPFKDRLWYGAMTPLDDSRIIAYVYHSGDEHFLRYTISADSGNTWGPVEKAFFAKRIRNPQLSERLEGKFWMHGRSGQGGEDPRHLVLYSSEDGIHWDEGVFLNKGATNDLDSYSTNALVGIHDDDRPVRLLLQSSIAYSRNGRRVNLHHWFIQ